MKNITNSIRRSIWVLLAVLFAFNYAYAFEYDDEEFSVYDRVFFEEKSSELSPESKEILNYQIEWFKRNPDKIIRLEGHADDEINREGNLFLGEKRAEKVREYMVSKDVPNSKIHIISYGKEMPFAKGESAEVKAANRRVVTIMKKAVK